MNPSLDEPDPDVVRLALGVPRPQVLLHLLVRGERRVPVVLHVEDAEPGGGRGVPRRDHLLQELHLEVGARREQPIPALHHDLKWRDASADYSSLCFELATLIHLLIQGVPSARGPRFG